MVCMRRGNIYLCPMRNFTFGILVLSLFLVAACDQNEYSIKYEAQPVDLRIIAKGKSFFVDGSSALQLRDTFVWGGSPVKINDLYYLFYSAWESGPDVPEFSQSWVLNSKIGVAVSEFPDRNFRNMGIFLKGRNAEGDAIAWDAQSAHNPVIKSFYGKYYLYYVSSVDPGIQPEGSRGAMLSKRDRIQ